MPCHPQEVSTTAIIATAETRLASRPTRSPFIARVRFSRKLIGPLLLQRGVEGPPARVPVPVEALPRVRWRPTDLLGSRRGPAREAAPAADTTAAAAGCSRCRR